MSKWRKATSLAVGLAMVLNCFGMLFTADVSQKLFPKKESGLTMDAVDENALENAAKPIEDNDEFDYINEDFVIDDTFKAQANYIATIADVNDYSLIRSENKEYMKLTVDSGSDASNSLNIVFSDAGQNSFVLRDNYFLEYDVMMEGNMEGTGLIDLQTANGNIVLSELEYGYDTEGIRAVGTNNLSGYANNQWYSRKIPIPTEMAGTKIYRWTVMQKGNVASVRTVTYFANIRITDAKGNVLLQVEPTQENLTCRVIDKSGVENYTLKMSKLARDEIHPQGDFLRFLIASDELEDGTSAYINYAFSQQGRGAYQIKKGDVLVYKVKNVNPFIKGSATVDIRFKNKAWLSDTDLNDQNGKSIYPSTDLRAESGGFWYYRAIEIPDKYVGLYVDYFTFKTLNTASSTEYEIQLADVKIINNDKTSLLVYGGGDVIDGGMVANRNAEMSAMRNHSASDEASPSGDYLKGTLYTHKSERLTTNVRISTKKYTIQEGDFLEYDMTTFDSMLANSGFSIDVLFASGDSGSNYAWRDQNALSAVPGFDITDKTSGRWYHRKIDLTDMTGEEIESWLICGEINSAQTVPVDGHTYFYGFDNIRITNNGKTVATVYQDGRVEESTVVRRVNCENTFVSSTPYEAPKPLYQVPNFTVSTDDAPVIAYNVKDFGAKGDGKTDDTDAIQSALFAADQLGGGVVFVPAGKYVIKTHLYVPGSVQLRGEWQNPLTGGSFKGTLLMAYEGQDNLDEQAFITLDRGGSLSHLAVWYPEQNASAVKPYPWTIQNHYGESSVTNVTLYNSYYGIKYGNGTSNSQIVEHVYATFLSRGFEIDCNFDLPRYNTVYVTPEVWEKSGLTGAPSGNALTSLKNTLVANLEAFRTGRVDGMEMYDIHVDYAKIGLIYDIARNIEPLTITEGGAFGNVTNVILNNVNTGFQINGLAAMGVVVTKGSINANQGTDPAAIRTGEDFNTYVSFAELELNGNGSSLIADGNGIVSLQGIVFKPGSGKAAMVLNNGLLHMNGCDLQNASNDMQIGKDFKNATANGNTGLEVSSDKVLVDNTPQEFKTVGENATHDDKPMPKPGKTTVFNVLDYGAKNDGTTDATDAIQKAIDAAAKNGGGIAYVPAGKYRIDGNILVKSGVELRGAMHSFHHTVAGASIFEVYGGRGKAEGTATVKLEKNAGFSGMTFFYPEQLAWEDVVAYPWAIQSLDEGTYVTNTSFVNAYRGIDFYTNNSDKHYIANIGAGFLESGIFVGNSPTYGTIRNTQQVIHFWTSYKDYGCIVETGDVMQTETFRTTASNLISYQFGDCKNESVLANFGWISQVNIRFQDQGEGGFNGKFINPGTDGSFINYDIIASEEINLVGAYMYVHGHDIYSPERAYIKSHKTNGGTVNVHNILGHDNGLDLDHFLIYNGDITIQQMGSNSAKNNNANIKGGIVKLVGITNRPCTTAYGGGFDPMDIVVSRDVQKLTVIGWMNVNRSGKSKVQSDAGEKYQSYGFVNFQK